MLFADIEIRTGSDSDIPKIKEAYEVLDNLGISYETRILSAHRTPDEMAQAAKKLEQKGLRVSIAAAGGSAHLPGMTASHTIVPVVGIPVYTRELGGLDSLYSIIQMPDGVPVGCVGIGQAESAALLAAQVASLDRPDRRSAIRAYRQLGTLPAQIPHKNSVAFLRPNCMQLKGDAEAKYRASVGLLRDLAHPSYEELSAAPVDEASLRALLRELEEDSTKVIIAFGNYEYNGADGAIYFPRVVAEHTDIPVIGVPVVEGEISKHSVDRNPLCQMLCHHDAEGDARGYPVAGMGINRFTNAALYAAQILGIYFPDFKENIRKRREMASEAVVIKDAHARAAGVREYVAQMKR